MKRKVALVTGAGGKLGSQIAIFLSRRGYDLALHYNSNLENVLKTQQIIASFGGRSKLFQVDFANLSEVELLVAEVSKTLSKPSLLVNSGSVFNKSNLLETTKESLQEMITVNSMAPYLLMTQFALCSKNGLIVNLLDQKISLKKTAYLPYTLSKKFLADLTVLSSVELAPATRVNGIAPQNISDVRDIASIDTEQLDYSERVEDVLDAIDYFISNKEVTGEIIFTAKVGKIG